MSLLSLRIFPSFLLIFCLLVSFILQGLPLSSGFILLAQDSVEDNRVIKFTQQHRQALQRLMQKSPHQRDKFISSDDISNILGVSPSFVSGNLYRWNDSFNRSVEVRFNSVSGGVSRWNCRGF